MWESKIDAGAKIDYDETVDWYLSQDPQAALRFIDAAKVTLASILSDPERFVTIASGTYGVMIKSFPVQIVYQIHGSVVEILAYSHASRRPGYWTSRRN